MIHRCLDGFERARKSREAVDTAAAFFNKFEEYCTPRKNLVMERRRFFLRSQEMEESIDSHVTELRNLATTCEFDAIRDGLILYKVVDGILSDKVWDTLLRKGADLTLSKAIDICRADELTKSQMKLMNKDKEIAGVTKKVNGYSRKFKDANGLQKFKQNSGIRDFGNMVGKQREDRVVRSRAKCRKCGREFMSQRIVLHMVNQVSYENIKVITYTNQG